MKIQVFPQDGPTITIPLPNAMLFSPTLLNFGLKIGSRYSGQAMPEIPPETVKKVCAAIKDYRKQAGSWELVHVESTDGATIIITV